MYNKEKFVKDYMEESEIRLQIAKDILGKKRYNTVIRECQTSVELAIKSVLFRWGRVIPRTHNLREELKEIKDLLSKELQENFDFIYKTSNRLYSEREQTLYGDVDLDLTPSESYSEKDAKKYLEDSEKIIALIKKELKTFLENKKQ